MVVSMARDTNLRACWVDWSVTASLTTPSDLLHFHTLVVPSSLRRGRMQSTERRLSLLRHRSYGKRQD